MQSKATTVDKYLAELPPDRRAAIAAVRATILKNLPQGYEEGMQYGMIGFYVPHSIYSAGYHCDPRQPLPFVCLASQKNYMSLYMACVYDDGEQATRFREAWAKSGKKLDMGKSCIRFKKLDDLPLDVIGQAVKRMPVEKHIAWYEKAMKLNAERREGRSNAKKPAARKKAVKKVAVKKKAPRRKVK